MEISLPFLISADRNAGMMADTQAAIILGGSHLGRQPSWAMRRKLLQSSAEQ